MNKDKFVLIMNKFASVINQNKYISSIRDAFSILSAVIIVTSFITVFSEIVLNNKQNLSSINLLILLGSNLNKIANFINDAIFNFFTVYIVFLIGLELGTKNKINSLFSGVGSLLSYLVINPRISNFLQNEENFRISNLFAQQYTNLHNLFLGTFVSLASFRLYFCFKQVLNLRLKSRNRTVNKIFKILSALIASALATLLMFASGLLTSLVTKRTLDDIFYCFVQRPLQNIIQGLPGILFLVLISQLFWVVGLHGVQIIKPVREPLLIMAIIANAKAHIEGKILPNIVNLPFWNMYIALGGSGVTIGLLNAVFLLGKRHQALRNSVSSALLPGFLNINEAVIFGVPVVGNPTLMLPFIVTPFVTGTIGYVATATGFAAKAFAYTPCPIFIDGFLATGGDWGAVVTQGICVIVATLIYLPFVKILDKQTELNKI